MRTLLLLMLVALLPVGLVSAAPPSKNCLSHLRPPSPPVVKAKGIPATALARIASIKPGMTRADLHRVFTTEGGTSTTYWNHYVYRDETVSVPAPADGKGRVVTKFIKVNIDFAPRDADIVWLNGRGFWLHQSHYLRHAKPLYWEERPDDVILHVSSPYLEGYDAN